MGNIEESIDKLWDFSRKLYGEDRLDIRHRIDELEAENERLVRELFRIRTLTFRKEHLSVDRVLTVARIAQEAVLDYDEPKTEGE